MLFRVWLFTRTADVTCSEILLFYALFFTKVSMVAFSLDFHFRFNATSEKKSMKKCE